MLSSRLLEQVFRTVETLPPDSIQSVVAVLETEAALSPTLRDRVLASVALPQERIVLTSLLLAYEYENKSVSPESLAVALASTLHTRTTMERVSQVELVWTGPPSGMTFRRTDQALLQVIQVAQRDLLLVTFAAYRSPLLQDAIRKAVKRGVTVRFVAETVEGSGGRLSLDAARALRDIADQIRFYVWPREQRQSDHEGRVGSLHAKCALADEELLLISSANLTEHAMLLNMEMGLLIQGGPAPAQVREHFQQLLERGHITSA